VVTGLDPDKIMAEHDDEIRQAKADGWDECHRASLGGFDATNPYRDGDRLTPEERDALNDADRVPE
jgi:hypothetical protein